MDAAKPAMLLICHYRYLASDYLLFCLLGSKDHFELTEQLELATSRHLDISRMQLAARLDLWREALSASIPEEPKDE